MEEEEVTEMVEDRGSLFGSLRDKEGSGFVVVAQTCVTLLVVQATLRLQGKDKEAEGRPCFRQIS